MDKADVDRDDTLRTVNTFATDTYSHLRDTISLADQKAGFLFSVVTAILAYLHTNGATKRFLENLKGLQVGLSDILVGIAVIGLVIGAITALFVVIPRAPTATKGIVASWGIASFDKSHEFIEQVLHSDPSDLARAKLEYCWVLARISRKKYRFIKLALRFGFVGLVASVAYLALG